ncbi:MAG: sigma-70 family RNA polymerase sigma factor [Planctomycetes bacterium]|nr:sigma-70 family RNA polymerase sigma factor [Planctomycetota bacterium]
MTNPPLPPSDLPDELLAGRAQGGDRAAFEALVVRTLGPARAFCTKLLRDPVLAEDACQEGFLKAWRGLPGFRGDSKFRTWLWRIFANVANDMRKPKPAQIGDMDFEAIPERDVAAEESVAREIAALPDRQREVLLMKVELDLSPAEIAEALGISYEAVKASLSLARKKLKERLE